jgi:hypothetical protein
MRAGYLPSSPRFLSSIHHPTLQSVFLLSLTLLLLKPPGYPTRDPIVTDRSSDSNRTLVDSASAMFGDGG